MRRFVIWLLHFELVFFQAKYIQQRFGRRGILSLLYWFFENARVCGAVADDPARIRDRIRHDDELRDLARPGEYFPRHLCVVGCQQYPCIVEAL